MRTIDLTPHEGDDLLAEFVIGLELQRRRVWPCYGKTYDEPMVVFDGREWTLDGIATHLRILTHDSRRETEAAQAGSERAVRPATTLRHGS